MWAAGAPLPPPLPGPRYWTLTFFGHEVDEAAPHLHLGGLDLTLAWWCPSADTQEGMSSTLGALPARVPQTSTLPLQLGRGEGPGCIQAWAGVDRR